MPIVQCFPQAENLLKVVDPEKKQRLGVGEDQFKSWLGSSSESTS